MHPVTQSPDKTPAHERVYRTLRQRVMMGELPPGQPLTLRGIASEFRVSMTPAREAVRRLAAEGGLSLSSSGRVFTPELGRERLEELGAIRALLEPELAIRALPRAYPALIDRLGTINTDVSEQIAMHDASGYIRRNLDFHRTLYLRAQAPAMLALVETVWLQLGPTMRRLYGRTNKAARPGQHRLILSALKSGDERALRNAVESDVTLGLRLLSD